MKKESDFNLKSMLQKNEILESIIHRRNYWRIISLPVRIFGPIANMLHPGKLRQCQALWFSHSVTTSMLLGLIVVVRGKPQEQGQ